jgi:hypothetical protein
VCIQISKITCPALFLDWIALVDRIFRFRYHGFLLGSPLVGFFHNSTTKQRVYHVSSDLDSRTTETDLVTSSWPIGVALSNPSCIYSMTHTPMAFPCHISLSHDELRLLSANMVLLHVRSSHCFLLSRHFGSPSAR